MCTKLRDTEKKFIKNFTHILAISIILQTSYILQVFLDTTLYRVFVFLKSRGVLLHLHLEIVKYFQ